MTAVKDTFDYIVIGGGTAGCTVAARLSEDPSVSVFLLESGRERGTLLDFWKIEMPAAFNYVWRNPQYNWMYQGEPEPTLNNRRIFQPRGKILGGSSAINGMVFIRGHAKDYDRWVGEGAKGWSWREVLPYFRRLETWEGGESAYRGGSGPVRVCKGKLDNLLYQTFLESGQQAGFPLTDDINGELQEGFGALQMNVDRGVRASTAQAYIRPNVGRKNLTLFTESHAQELLVSGNRVTGVRFTRRGDSRLAHAAREVIVTSGAVNSPQLLMLSGIGSAEDLAAVGIKCRVDLPGVGSNLQDHPLVYMKFKIEKPISISRYMRPDRKLATGARWLMTRGGIGASNLVETCALIRSDPSVSHPDVEIQFLPVVTDHGDGITPDLHGFTYCIGATRVERAGWVKLRSSDPKDPPRILSNFLSTDHDLGQMRKAVEFGRYLSSRPAYAHLGVTEMEPGKKIQSRGEMDDYIRSHTSGDFHLVGTCRMGSDQMSVVDTQMRVHGIEGLRVVDASVMPSIVSANTCATTIMIAERGSDMIRGAELLPPADALEVASDHVS